MAEPQDSRDGDKRQRNVKQVETMEAGAATMSVHAAEQMMYDGASHAPFVGVNVLGDDYTATEQPFAESSQAAAKRTMAHNGSPADMGNTEMWVFRITRRAR
jgi:hypothetical protein